MLIFVGKLDYFLLSFCCHMYFELNQLSTFFYYFAFILFLDFCYCVSFIVASFNFGKYANCQIGRELCTWLWWADDSHFICNFGERTTETWDRNPFYREGLKLSNFPKVYLLYWEYHATAKAKNIGYYHYLRVP